MKREFDFYLSLGLLLISTLVFGVGLVSESLLHILESFWMALVAIYFKIPCNPVGRTNTHPDHPEYSQ